MDELQGRRLRRLRLRRHVDAPIERETVESVLPELPRVAALDALLREVDSIRLTLETDLTMAASAVEHGAPDVAADIIDSDREALAEFERRGLAHLAELAVHPKRRVRVPLAPFVAAAAVVAFVVVALPHTGSSAPGATEVSLNPSASLSRLTLAAGHHETSQVIDAAAQLHAQLEGVVATAGANPAQARAALLMLMQERTAIQASGGANSPALQSILKQSNALSSLIMGVIAGVPTAVPVTTGSPLPVVVPTFRPTPQASHTTAAATASPKTSPSSSPTRKASPKPTHKASPKPSTAPSASPTPGPGHLPTTSNSYFP